jgi:hypothetical protein
MAASVRRGRSAGRGNQSLTSCPRRESPRVSPVTQRAFLTTFGATARLPARPGRVARRALRGARSRVRKPMTITFPNLPGTDTKPQ